MNRSDLINALTEEVNLSRKDAEKIVDTFFQTITDTLGSFTVKKYKPYTGRNPKTGVQIRVPAKKLPFFKVGKELKEMVDEVDDD